MPLIDNFRQTNFHLLLFGFFFWFRSIMFTHHTHTHTPTFVLHIYSTAYTTLNIIAVDKILFEFYMFSAGNLNISKHIRNCALFVLRFIIQMDEIVVVAFTIPCIRNVIYRSTKRIFIESWMRNCDCSYSLSEAIINLKAQSVKCNVNAVVTWYNKQCLVLSSRRHTNLLSFSHDVLSVLCTYNFFFSLYLVRFWYIQNMREIMMRIERQHQQDTIADKVNNLKKSKKKGKIRM